MTSKASSLELKFGAKPPSSPTAVFIPFEFKTDFNSWKTSVPICRVSENVFPLIGITINS